MALLFTHRRSPASPRIGRSHFAHRSLAVLLAVVALLATTAGAALADDPELAAPQYQPIPLTTEEAAGELAKQALADAVGEYAATGVWEVSPEYCTESTNVYCSEPSSSAKLGLYARRQINDYYCGPASTQAVINYTRGYLYSTLDGQDPDKNWKKQSVIGSKMGTDDAGESSSYMIRDYLNGKTTGTTTAKNPAGWWWYRKVNDSGQQMHNRIVSDVWNWSMPVILAVMPHKPGEPGLPSWPMAVSSPGHFIAIRGYAGFWNGGDGPQIYYVDSSSNGGMDPGRYPVGAWTMWRVNDLNHNTIVW